jgi:acyl-CoA dehydrogenase
VSTFAAVADSASLPASADLPVIAARIGAEVVGPAAGGVDRAARFPSEAFEALRAERMLSVLIPVDLGGSGARLVDVARATEALGRHCASTGLIYAMHQIQVACLVRHGRNQWARAFLADVAAGELLLASATTELGVGGDVRSSVCSVERTGDRFRLQKNTPVISYGNYADAILVTARREADSPANDQVLVVVPVVETTLEQRSGWDTLGFRGTCSNGFLLTAEGDVDQVLSDPYADISARTMLPTSHVVWSSVWLGIAKAAVDNARVCIRGEARKKPGTMPPAAVRLADLVGMLGQLEALVHGAAVDYETVIDDDDKLSSMSFAIQMNALKTSASNLVVAIVGRAMTICGMAGYREDSPLSLSRHIRDAYGAELMINNDRILGANAQMLLVHKGD